ncbi:MAG: hypothetical protein FWG30_01265 [Eubacteriaceae bacterium]|nr:hypothetical protein [Eubacteriaceae bacterium]
MSKIKNNKLPSRKSLIIAATVLIVAIAVFVIFQKAPGRIPDFANIDFSLSPYKHITNGGINTSDKLPYNVDAITGATVTVEGPAVASSVPLSMREMENRNDGLFRGVYKDSSGERIYEGLELYCLLTGMANGDKGIILTDKASKVLLKNSSRETIASISIDEIASAHNKGKPYLLAYGVGTLDEKFAAPFVFDAANPNEHSEGYISELGNADGCLKLVYGMNASDAKRNTFTNVAYIYISEEEEPGFKHTGAGSHEYSTSKYTDYIITFRGEALGCEMDFTVQQLESHANYSSDGKLVQGGMGYLDEYSLANNAYWYVNEYEGLDLYKLLLYLGMSDAESMGLAASRTTLARFVADDGFFAPESFSVDALSYPDTFGFYIKNAIDPGDGSYAPTNADLVRTGYPVLMAFGVNRYPYTISKQDAGYLSGLSNDGGPMRIVFGKTQYGHPNGSNQVKFLRDVIIGKDVLYNTHKYSSDTAHQALAGDSLDITVTGEDGALIMRSTMSVGDIEDLVYAEGVSAKESKSARIKDHYQRETGSGYASEIYEGINLEYFLMDVLGLPGTNGTVTFSGGGNEKATVNLSDLLRSGYNTQLGRDRITPVIAFAKNGSPMVFGADSEGYKDQLALKPSLESDPGHYIVENSGGPLAVFIPSSDPENCNAISCLNVTSIDIELVPDSYAHINEPYSNYALSTVRFYGDGLSGEQSLSVRELESRQRKAKTLDFCLPGDGGKAVEQRYRGLPIYELFIEMGIKSNAGDVIFYDSSGNSFRFSLSALKKNNYINQLSPHKEALTAMLAYGKGQAGDNPMEGAPLVPSVDSNGYDAKRQNGAGPLKLIIPGETADAAAIVDDIAAVEVTANEIELWGHRMSDIYKDFLDYRLTLTVINDDSEWSHDFTLGQLEEMADLIVRDKYAVLDIGECEGIDIWKFIKRFAGSVPGIENPVSITVYAADGYKNDLLSVFYLDGFEYGVDDGSGDKKPLLLAYAVNGLPLVDSENHEGYTGLAGNASGPLRVIAETNQGASVKYAVKLVVAVSGSGELDSYISQDYLP